MTDKSAEEAVEVLYGNALRELQEDDEPGDEPLAEADKERVRAFIRAGYKPGMSAEQAAALQEAAVHNLLQALEFGSRDPLASLLAEVRALGEVVDQVKRARATAAHGS
ncbi:hypothetical protein OG423_05765 [Micromonospora zamorensis]|uniref:hypothetical protein n=1 Tax=Micromonospora zamorensis TaxID=709883 RepID=UPI00352A2CCF|nr:hypothetical protein OG423_05765 [Micromonospora zamorensis]